MIRKTQILLKFTGLLLISRVAPAGTLLYLEDNTRQFGTVDTGTGAFTLAGTISTLLFGMGFDTSGRLDANDSGLAPNTGFYRVDPSTAGLTFVANMNNASSSSSLASRNGGGTLYLTNTPAYYAGHTGRHFPWPGRHRARAAESGD